MGPLRCSNYRSLVSRGSTYDSSSTSNMPTFYVNGVAYAPSITFIAPSGNYQSDSGIALYLGASRGNRQFDGVIDDARVYNYQLTTNKSSPL